MDEISMIGLDIAKNVFHIHGVDATGAPALQRQLRRGQVEKFFAQLPPTLVGLEACGSAHHWPASSGRCWPREANTEFARAFRLLRN